MRECVSHAEVKEPCFLYFIFMFKIITYIKNDLQILKLILGFKTLRLAVKTIIGFVPSRTLILDSLRK